MDKFTVDLDQVLNDFEYSELTDQYSSGKETGSSSAVPIQNVTKHSINNVFYSLNEYLNTNVNSLEHNDNNECMGDFSDSKKVDTSIEDNKTESNSVSQFEEVERTLNNESSFPASEGFLKQELQEVEVNLYSEDNNSEIVINSDETIEQPFKNEKLVDILEESFDNDLLKYESTGNNVDLHTELQNVVGNNFGIKYEQNAINPSLDVKELKSVIGFEQDLHLDDQEISRLLSELEEDDDLNVDEINESQVLETVDNVIDCESVGINNDENRSFKDLEILDTDVKKDSNGYGLKQENFDTLNLEYIKTMNGDVEDIFCDKSFVSEETSLNDEKNIKDQRSDNEDTHITEKVVIETAKSENIEIVESEDLFNIIQKADINNVQLNQVERELEIRPFENVQDNEQPLQQEISDNCPKNTGTEFDDFKEYKYCEKTDSTISNEILDSNMDSHVSGMEIQTEMNMKEENDNLELIESTLTESSTEKGETRDNIQETNVENSSLDVEIGESTELITRPQHLSLGTDPTESNRKIDLIGDPGSTPYNNLYVNNEIAKQEHNGDLDSSSSSTSPTFSDASSTASTASTEDIQYKQDSNEQTDINDSKQLINSSNEVSESLPSVSTGNSANIGEQNFEDTDEIPQDTTHSESSHNQRETLQEQPNVSGERCWLGKEAPLWIPDSEAISCLHCDMKFTMLKRRHHCRACGLVLCSKCCHLRFRLEYLDAEARVCNRCHDILNKESGSSSSSDISPEGGNSPSHRPNPNNPAEYCSTISPLQQMGSSHNSPPAVMVPVGVLKRKGSNKTKSSKSVMFCDGIRPGSDLTNLDNDFNYNNTITKKLEKNNSSAGKLNRNLPLIDSETNTFIPKNENSLPPTITVNKSYVKYTECPNNINTVNVLKNTQLTYAIHLSLLVHVKIINMDCCVNKVAWCFSTEGLINVGQDEIIILLEYLEEESTVPKDIFYHITTVYNDAVKGNSIKELGLSLQNSTNFLCSKSHAGFIYVRPTFQCLENVIKPKDPFLIGILIHRWETPWAKLFPLRLVLRLGAEYRYYPSPIISTRHRDSVYVEIGHTIINILADFRNFSYSLPQIDGLTIFMEEKITTVSIPVNRYDHVMKSLNNSSDHILAFAGNFCVEADSHLVCIQDTQGNENCYSTHAINIHNKPRKITGTSFIVFNGALKTSSGLTAKSNIIEDGLMIQVLPEHLKQIRENLRAMKNHTISCGCVDDVSDETVQIIWSENDSNFNVGVISTIDNMPLSGIPSIRVHNGNNLIFHNGSRIIRWTEVFIIQNGEDNPRTQDPVDISRVSENIAKGTCDALVKYLDLLIANNFQKIGIRVTLHVDNVSYCAGSNGTKLPPIYMKSLDNELIPVLHRITSNNFGENSIVLELIFRILNV